MVCTVCGSSLVGDLELCPHHTAGVDGDDWEWSRGNRIICDFIHRGIVPVRVASSEREPETTIAGWGMF